MKTTSILLASLLLGLAPACASGTDSSDDANGSAAAVSAAPTTDSEAGKACGPLNALHPKCADGFDCNIHGDSGICVKSESEAGRACGPLNTTHPDCADGFRCKLLGDSGICVAP